MSTRRNQNLASDTELTAQRVAIGPQVSAANRIKLYNSDEWEEFIAEWADSLKSEYHFVDRIGGSGDQGRDVVAFTGEPNTDCPWDNYQCKHYKNSLGKPDIWLELGKLCYYTFMDEFTVPRKYYFVAPGGVTTPLYKLLSNPEDVKIIRVVCR